MKHELQHPCMICGKCESTVTVYRAWLRSFVRSDECTECHVYMNELATIQRARAAVRRREQYNSKVICIERN